MTFVKHRARRFEPRVIQPLVNIQETDKEVILEAEMTGLTREDIALELKGNELTIRGKTREQDEVVPKGYTVIHRERCPLEYARTFVIGEEIDMNKIDAQYENGILRVRLVKSSQDQPKRIEIKD
ncbi:MAG: Hsp20/alpha crystallin family protein [Candidatus Omnitrophica bacterium]|nr:Hsp20/alpha crystallin family protein [Candidatus Omnitrophota bacterium]